MGADLRGVRCSQGLSGRGSELPEGADRYSAQLWAEWECGCAGVEDYAEDEVAAEFGAELPESVEVLGSCGGRRLDFDADDLAVPVFQDAVHLYLVVVAIVIEVREAV